MNDKIINVQLQFKCPALWDEMEVICGTTRFCTHCAKQVYDFTDARQGEFVKMLAEGGNSVCGRFKSEQMAPQPLKLYGWQRWASAALLVLGVNLFQGKVFAQSTPAKTNQTVKEDPSQIIKIDEPVGVCGTPQYDEAPQFPGGDQNFFAFLDRNIKFSEGMKEGRMFITINVELDGSVKEIKILRSIDQQNDAEAIRVLKLMPKWKPAKLKGKWVKGPYTFPISFKKDKAAV